MKSTRALDGTDPGLNMNSAPAVPFRVHCSFKQHELSSISFSSFQAPRSLSDFQAECERSSVKMSCSVIETYLYKWFNIPRHAGFLNALLLKFYVTCVLKVSFSKILLTGQTWTSRWLFCVFSRKIEGRSVLLKGPISVPSLIHKMSWIRTVFHQILYK